MKPINNSTFFNMLLGVVMFISSSVVLSDLNVSFDDLKQNFSQGFLSNIIIRVEDCTEEYEGSSTSFWKTNFLPKEGLERLISLTTEGADLDHISGTDDYSLILKYYKKLTHTPTSNTTKLGAIYDVVAYFIVTSSKTSYFLMEARETESGAVINTKINCPWNALKINLNPYR